MITRLEVHSTGSVFGQLMEPDEEIGLTELR